MLRAAERGRSCRTLNCLLPGPLLMLCLLLLFSFPSFPLPRASWIGHFCVLSTGATDRSWGSSHLNPAEDQRTKLGRRQFFMSSRPVRPTKGDPISKQKTSNVSSGGRRDGSVVESIYRSSRGLRFHSGTLNASSQLSGTLVLCVCVWGGCRSSSGFQGHCIHLVHRHAYR